MSVAKSKIPNDLVHRQLDDVPSACPEDKDWGENFNECYTNLCEEVGIKLAPNCKKMEKAFEYEKMGKVLGIFIDSTIMGWSLPADKKRKAINSITECIESSLFNLLKMQKLV